jgi:hypothetical protein
MIPHEFISLLGSLVYLGRLNKTMFGAIARKYNKLSEFAKSKKKPMTRI